jgi:RAD50-interacting protein 1
VTCLIRRWDTPEDSSADALEWQPGTALVTAMSALSSQLGLLARTLPPKDLSKIYRLTVAHLSNHILQRAVFAGWSKYTATGGLELALEVDAWCEVCIIGLDGHVRKPEAPWRELRDASVILSLPQEPSGDGRPSFSQAMALAFGGDLDRLRERLGIVLEDQKIQSIMRRRIECWR